MIGFIFKKWFLCVCDLNEFCGESREKIFQQVAPGEVLQSFVGMGDIALHSHEWKEKAFIFFDLPDGQPGVGVNILLKKNGHGFKFHDYFATPINSISQIQFHDPV
jgi:hypothetical protein